MTMPHDPLDKWGYTYEQIYRRIKGTLTIDNDELADILSQTLSKVSRQVVDEILEKCQFIMVDDVDGMHIPKKMNLGKDLIVFSERLLEEESEKYINKAILHEIAHCYLSHKSPRLDKLSKREMKCQEDEAEKLARAWLRKKNEKI